MSLLQYYAEVVSRPSDASTSSETRESSTDGHAGDEATHTSDDTGKSQRLTEEPEASPPKRPRIVSDCKLSAIKNCIPAFGAVLAMMLCTV